MNEKKYDWGELHDTLREMETELEDTSFLKCLRLVTALENSRTLEGIRNSVDMFPLSEYELDRFNSLCLDGIVNTIYNLDPLLTLILRTNNVRAFKYYSSRGFLQECHVVQLCKLGRTEMLEFAIDEKCFESYGSFDIYRLSSVIIYDEINNNCNIGYLTAAYGNMDTTQMFLEKFPHYSTEIIKASLATKNIKMTKMIIDIAYEHFKEERYKDDDLLEWCLLRLCEYGELEMIKYMVKRGEVDLNFDGVSCMFEARYFHQDETVEYLLSIGLPEVLPIGGGDKCWYYNMELKE